MLTLFRIVVFCTVSFTILACSHPAKAARPLPAQVAFTDPYEDGYVLALWGKQYDTQELNAIFRRLKQTGTRHIQVAFFGCQSTIHSADVGACELRPWTYMTSVVDRAIANGFNTTILPLMGGKNWEWRGYFDPKDVDLWFENYTKWIVRVAQVAESRKLKELVIGSEFSILQREESHWRRVAEAVRKVYHGPLVFTVNWDALNIGFWDAVDAIGVSAYFPLSKEKNPAQNLLNDAWNKKRGELLSLATKWNRPLHITEVGYVSGSSAAATPWHTPQGDTPDQPLQMRCFEAFRQAWKSEKKLVRANVWATSGPESENLDVSSDPVGRQAEATLKAFFEERASIKRR